MYGAGGLQNCCTKLATVQMFRLGHQHRQKGLIAGGFITYGPRNWLIGRATTARRAHVCSV